MSKIDDGGPAFARPISHDGPGPRAEAFSAQDGMSLRDYFAAVALTGVALELNWQDAAEHSYACADAMLAERAKRRDGAA